ncbi:hypothetical protein N9317_05935 [Pelagibacteraceae bacterium]|nr:hypothetical protein [Pelagibacteraceae bacterium]
MKKNFGILITARLKSKRLKKKLIKKISGQTVIEYLINNLKKTFDNKKIILITSKSNQDKILTDLAKKNNIRFFCGEPQDVLKRIYDASKKFKFKNVLSCTADNPLIDCEQAKKMMSFHELKKNDLTINKGLPLGLFCYCLRVNSITDILKKKADKDTETWLPYFTQSREKKVGIFKSNIKNKNYLIDKIRLTMDEKEDFKLIKKIVKLSNWHKPNVKDIITIFKKNPKLIDINKNIKQRKSALPKMKND